MNGGVNQFRLKRCLVATVCTVSSMGVHAVDFEVDGWQGTLSTTVSLGSSWRAESQDSRLLFGANAPGGTAGERFDAKNLNWDKGDRFTTPLKAVFDLSVRKNDAGAFVRVKAWYDQALENESVRYGNASTGYRPGKLSDSGQATLNKFKGVELLDAYVYNTFDVAERPLQVRLGKQVVNWGESLFLQGVNQLNPIDTTALTKPGTEIKEAFLPVESLYANLGLGGGVSLEGFYQLKWRPHVVDNCGTYWSPVEFGISTSSSGDTGCNGIATAVAAGSTSFAIQNGLYTPLINGKNGRDSGQWGLALRSPIDLIDAEFGAYAMNINSRSPFISAVRGQAVGAIPAAGLPAFLSALPVHAALGAATQTAAAFWEYPNDIRVFGASLSTNLAGWSVASELSYTPNQPVQINGVDIVYGALLGIGPMGGVAAGTAPGSVIQGYDRIKKTQFQINTVKILPSALGAAQGLLLAEVGAQWNDVPDADSGKRYGRPFIFGLGSSSSIPAGGSTCANPVAALNVNASADGCQNDGFVTKSSWGYRAKVSLDYMNAFESGYTLTPSVFFSHDVSGYSSDGQFVEGRRILTLGLKADYQKKYAVEFGYTTFANSAKYDQFRDHDFYSVSLTSSF